MPVPTYVGDLGREQTACRVRSRGNAHGNIRPVLSRRKNHPASGNYRRGFDIAGRHFSHILDPKYLGKDVAKLEIVEYLRSANGIHGAVRDFRVEDTDCSVAFKGPGYSADVLIDRATGRYELTETRLGFFAVINDLHKGRDSGSAWAIIIDVSAVLMTLVSLTGMLLIFFLQKKRFSGLLAAVAGIVLCYLAYLAWVP